MKTTNTITIDLRMRASGKSPNHWPCHKTVETSAKIAQALAEDIAKHNPFDLDIKIEGTICASAEAQSPTIDTK